LVQEKFSITKIMKLFIIAALLGLVAAAPAPVGRRGGLPLPVQVCFADWNREGMRQCVKESISAEDQKVIQAAIEEITWDCVGRLENGSQTRLGMEKGRCWPTPEAFEEMRDAFIAAFKAKAKQLDATFTACLGHVEVGGMIDCIIKKISIEDQKVMRVAIKSVIWECHEQTEGGSQTRPGMEKGSAGAKNWSRCSPTPEAQEDFRVIVKDVFLAKAGRLYDAFNACRCYAEGCSTVAVVCEAC